MIRPILPTSPRWKGDLHSSRLTRSGMQALQPSLVPVISIFYRTLCGSFPIDGHIDTEVEMSYSRLNLS